VFEAASKLNRLTKGDVEELEKTRETTRTGGSCSDWPDALA
jgi:hypothetical protein